MPTKLIGTEPYQVPRNADLGTSAFQDAGSMRIEGGYVATKDTLTTGLHQDTDVSDIRPSLLLDFANSKVMDPRVTFTRASTATYYDGRTTAKAEENLLTWSQRFNGAPWTTGANIGGISNIDNITIAPDGSVTGGKLQVSTTSNTNHYTLQMIELISGLTYTFSVYFKSAENTFVGMQLYRTGVATFGDFDLLNVTSNIRSGGGTATIIDVGNGWRRCTLTYTPTSTQSHGIEIYLTQSYGGTTAYAGTVGNGVYIWGAQLEQRSSATSYTPTTTQAITRYQPVLRTAAAGVPRFDHNPLTGESLGLLIEEQRTNLLTYSSTFSNAAWVKTYATILANAIIAPDGSNAGSAIIESNGTNGWQGAYQLVASVPSATAYTASVYMKAGFRKHAAIRLSPNGDSIRYVVTVDLTTGQVTSTYSNGGPTNTAYSVINVGNGWYRISATAAHTTTTGFFMTVVAADGPSPNYDGSFGYLPGYVGQASLGNAIYVWGAQLEAGSFATSYIPTVAAAVTRSAESASITGTNFTSWYNIQEGSIHTEFSTIKGVGGVSAGVLSLWNNTYTNFLDMRNPVSQPYIAIYADASTNITWNIGTALAAGTKHKWAVCYAVNDFTSSINGAAISVYPGLSRVPVVDRLLIGNLNTNEANSLSGHIKKIAYYPKRLSNAELQEITLP